MKDDDYVRIQRRDDLEKTLVYHGRLAPNEADPEKVADLFGGGFYRVQWFQRNETGQYFIKGTRTFKIPGPYKPPNELPGVGKAPGASTASAAQKPEIGNLDAANPVAMLNTALVGSVVDLLKTLKTPAPQPQTNPIPWGQIATVLSPVLLKLIERPTPQGGNVRDEVLAAMREMRDLLPQNNPASNAIADAVKGLKELMNLKDVVEGREAPPDPETAMWGAALKALEVIAPKLGGAPAQPPTATPALPPGAAPGMPKWKLMLLSQRGRLIQAASFGLPADTAAETALTFLPQQMHGVLTEFLEMPDHVEICLQTIPELREFKTWTEGFFAELRAQFIGEEEEDHAEEGPESTIE